MRSVTGFKRPRVFWLGAAAVTAGVTLHLPSFVDAQGDGYKLAGMGWSPLMIFGMALVVSGLIAVLHGMGLRSAKPVSGPGDGVEYRALDGSPLRSAHVKLMLVMTVAIAVDTEKPFTFTFILPGVASEYNMASPSHPAPGHAAVAWWPFVAIVGTALGSLVWGHIADRVGRRGSLLFIATMFMATAVCAAMPAFEWNLVMCFFMGFAAGGLLPIVYALLTETIPVQRRGQLIVLVAGLGTALGFLLASWSAHFLIPALSWRVMWFLNVPTGLSLILLNRYFPESPRFLLAQGRREEARAVMSAFGVAPQEKDDSAAPVAAEDGSAGTAGELFRAPYRGITAALIVFGLAWGVTNFGFLTWLPSYVKASGIGTDHITAILAKAALFSIPSSLLVAWLYGRWGSRKTLIASACLSALTLASFAVLGSGFPRHTFAFTLMLVLMLMSLWASIAVLAPYSAEVYPTKIRGVGSGISAGATKLGGVIAFGMSVAAVAPPALSGSALLGAVPAGIAAVMLLAFGIETRGRGLEEITGFFTQLRHGAPEIPDDAGVPGRPEAQLG